MQGSQVHMGTTPSLPVRAGQALMEAPRFLAGPQDVRIESRYRRHRGVRECARGRCDRRDVDPMTRELLDFIMGRIESLSVQTPVTFRHKMAASWEGHGHATLVTLNRPARGQVEALVGQVTHPLAQLVSNILDSGPPLARVVRNRRPKVESELIWNNALPARIT